PRAGTACAVVDRSGVPGVNEDSMKPWALTCVESQAAAALALVGWSVLGGAAAAGPAAAITSPAATKRVRSVRIGCPSCSCRRNRLVGRPDHLARNAPTPLPTTV